MVGEGATADDVSRLLANGRDGVPSLGDAPRRDMHPIQEPACGKGTAMMACNVE